VTRWEEASARVRECLRRRIVGMDDEIEKILLCILTRNHALLGRGPGACEDPPHFIARGAAGAVLRAHPVHAGPDAE